jgi:hypothetical protein
VIDLLHRNYFFKLLLAVQAAETALRAAAKEKAGEGVASALRNIYYCYSVQKTETFENI